MSDFHRLPPVLRAASILRLLMPLGLMVTFTTPLILNLVSSLQWGVYASRVEVIALNLGVVGMSCTWVVHLYSSRLRQPDARPFPLASWQSQVRAVVLPAAVSLGAIVLAIVISPTERIFEIVFPISLIGIGVCVVFALDERRAGSRSLRQTP